MKAVSLSSGILPWSQDASFQRELSSETFITGDQTWLSLGLHCCSDDQVDKP